VGVDLSASCLLYLFADQVVKKASLWSRLEGQHSVAVPCGRRPVQLGALERTMLAWALWGLRERGLIHLKADAPNHLRRTRLAVDADAPGLEGELFECCRDSRESISVVVTRWARGPRKSLPLDAVIAAVQDEAMSREILIDATPSDLSLRERLSSRRHRLFAEPDCRRIAALAPDFQEVLDRWTSSVEVEGALVGLQVTSADDRVMACPGPVTRRSSPPFASGRPPAGWSQREPEPVSESTPNIRTGRRWWPPSSRRPASRPALQGR
jgi:hypothetical protein